TCIVDVPTNQPPTNQQAWTKGRLATNSKTGNPTVADAPMSVWVMPAGMVVVGGSPTEDCRREGMRAKSELYKVREKQAPTRDAAASIMSNRATSSLARPRPILGRDCSWYWLFCFKILINSIVGK
ncbi:hypothetical protein BCR44DRAFT_41671, partial [Catenaria anguillulae PL171]